jgi:hexosaminidase
VQTLTRYNSPLRITLSLIVLLAVLPSHSLGNTADEGRKLQLLPEPKEVKLGDGNFRLNGRTRIVLQMGHQAEDRIAAETLMEEVEQQSGVRLAIGTAAKASKKSREIVLVRLDAGKWRKFLESHGLRADAIGDQGYLLFADKKRIVVGGLTGQGLFYGVQTLRQLLRPDGHEMVCPAVSIRDWPSMAGGRVQNDISQGPNPLMDFMNQPIRMPAEWAAK